MEPPADITGITMVTIKDPSPLIPVGIMVSTIAVVIVLVLLLV